MIKIFGKPENDKMLTGDFETAETFNIYFQNLVPSLDLKVPNNLLCLSNTKKR